jgi:hypothetical protein
MHQNYLEVTFRGGIPLAAYYYLPRRAGDKCVRVEKHGVGLLVDLAADGRPIGVEIAIPKLVTVDSVNAVLKAYGLQPIDADELAPLHRAE